jgi:hypothetical protein
LRPTLRTVSIIPGIENFAPGAHRHQQRVVGVAEPLAHRLLERGEVLGDLLGEPAGWPPVLEVVPAGLGGDREPGRHRQPEVGHLGEVGALAAEQVLLVLVALAEVVDSTKPSSPPTGMTCRPPVRSAG